MATPELGDDVIIFADPYDTSDSWQDGYYYYPAERWFYMWSDSQWYGREVVIAPSNYASSQLCSDCGNKSNQTKDLSCRTYVCPECGLEMDRDYNASLNLLKLAV